LRNLRFMLVGLLVATAAFTTHGIKVQLGDLHCSAGAQWIRRHTSSIVAVEATEASAVEQRAQYFALMPSRKLPEVSLDLRAFASKEDDHVEAGVFARQAGTVPEWRNIGVVAAEEDGKLTPAVAKQFDLITRWAYEVCNDFETNTLLMQLDGAPIEIAWAIKPPVPSLFEKLQGKEEEPPAFVEVAPGTAFDDGLRCGFLGSLARQYRGGGVSARNDRIVIGQPPEVPVRRESQKRFDSKYQKKDGMRGIIG